MRVPINFPSEADVIAEEVARFRALSPRARVRELGEMFDLYQLFAVSAANPKAVAQLAEDEENRAKAAIREFVARHE